MLFSNDGASLRFTRFLEPLARLAPDVAVSGAGGEK
ncbi:hypothetical protein BH11MYX1_BH11MYX1_09340 [soil metagenome]